MAPADSCARTQIKWPKFEQEKAMAAMPCGGYAAASSISSTQELRCNKINGQQDNEEDVYSNGNNGCATPKAKRFRIPEVLKCPPAPKKRRVMPNCSSNRSPIAFFASPDIELFFFSAFRNVSSASS
ncbi:hypothetical protein L6164_009403 [Bauhinia variegata]|uniref:Uncharacterized protein n=1 Tax=Bauhinia variegata TaxID=167791 RepID=A0ACB9PJT7_BAUVA|nr:hypothetical protein L6164_009403 [Bauhinia variegata]